MQILIILMSLKFTLGQENENPPPFPFGIENFGVQPNIESSSNIFKLDYLSHQSWQPINQWGFQDPIAVERVFQLVMTTTPLVPTERPFLPDHKNIPVNNNNGLLKDIGPINVGFGIGVPAVKDNDPVSVGVNLGSSGLAGKIPIFFTTQGEAMSLNDYDGDKRNIVPNKALRYYLAVQEARDLQKQFLLRQLIAQAQPLPINTQPKDPFE